MSNVRPAPIPPAQDPARVLSLEVALSRFTTPDGWAAHDISMLLKDADLIHAYITEGTVP